MKRAIYRILSVLAVVGIMLLIFPFIIPILLMFAGGISLMSMVYIILLILESEK